LKLEKMIEARLKRAADYQLLARAAAADTDKLRPDFYTDNGQEFLILPVEWMESNIIGHMIWDLTKEYLPDVECRFFDAGKKPETTPAWDEKFLLGLWFSFYSDSVHKRNRAKKSYELGQTHGQCIMVKHFFESVNPEILGANALVKDHFFFGNNSGEVVNKVPVVYDLRHRLHSYYKDPEVGDALLVLLNRIARAVQLSRLDNQQIDTVVEHNLISFEAIVGLYRQTLTVMRRGKAVQAKARTPNKPRSSPLLLPEESELLSKLISPFWDNLSHYEEQWSNVVAEIGFSAAKARVANIINVRWQILQKFAKMTTKRLQQIRAMDPDKLKVARKANITIDNVRAMLLARSSPMEVFMRELLDITPYGWLRVAVAKGFNKGVPASDKDAERILYMEMHQAYLKADLKHSKVMGASLEAIKQEAYSLRELEKVIKTVSRFSALLGEGTRQLSAITWSIKLSKLPGKLKALADIKSSLDRLIIDFRNCDQHYVGLAFEFNVVPNKTSDELEKALENFSSQFNNKLLILQLIVEQNKGELLTNSLLEKSISYELGRLASLG
jgi:hypothetical protein